MVKEKGIGSIFKSAGEGASLGSAVPGIGTAIGAIGGAALGIGQLISSGIKKKKAAGATPELTDPRTEAELERVRQQSRNLQAGTDPLTQANIREAEQQTASTQAKIARVTGGDTPGTISALLQAQRLGGRARNQAFGQAAQRQPFFQGLAQQISSGISDRELQLQQFKESTLLAERAQAKKAGQQNVLAGIASFPGLDKKLSDVIKGFAPKTRGEFDTVTPESGIENTLPPIEFDQEFPIGITA